MFWGMTAEQIRAWTAQFRNHTAEVMASAAENPAPIISSKHRRCAGCGKFMQKDEAHILVGSDYSHMTEQCMDKVATKIREEKPDWDWTPGNKEIRK